MITITHWLRLALAHCCMSIRARTGPRCVVNTLSDVAGRPCRFSQSSTFSLILSTSLRVDIGHTISFPAGLAGIIRSLSFLSFRFVPRQGAKNIFSVIEYCTVRTATTIQRMTQATVKTWERRFRIRNSHLDISGKFRKGGDLRFQEP